MKVRAIRDLCQLSGVALLETIAEGMKLALDNAINLENDAKCLHSRNTTGYDILMAIAREEAAKVLILLDAVRCPQNGEHFGNQLRRFCDHFSRGIYAEMCDWEPSHFGEVCLNIDRERKDLYLDGPNDTDWIFYNQITHDREQRLYVDYVKNGDEYIWLQPYSSERSCPHFTPRVIAIANSLQLSGCLSVDALTEIANIWRPINMIKDFPRKILREMNYKTLSALDAKKLLVSNDDDALKLICNYLPFPIYSCDLTMQKVDRAELEKRQQNGI